MNNFKTPYAQGISGFFDEDGEYELIKESEVHYFMGISKEDAKHQSFKLLEIFKIRYIKRFERLFWSL